MALTQLSYDLTIGEDWERLVVIKDTRTHRIRKVSNASATLKSPDGLLFPLTTSTNFEGGITLCLSALQTYDLSPGTYTFDVVADPWGSSQTVAQGTVEVAALDRITPLEGSPVMTLIVDQYTDFRRRFDWQSADSATMSIVDARMQAKNELGTVVLDIGFFNVAPDEGDIGLLDPDKRGYIAPLDPVLDSASFELHISNQLVLAPGRYHYDILALDAGGDWGKVVEGSLIMQVSTTNPI